jgi:hypothetical protein
MSEGWTCTDGWGVEKEEEERTRWTLTLDDATLRASFPCFPLFSLVFPLFLISVLSDGPQLVSHGRRNPGLLRYSLCGPGRPAARDSSRDPDQRLPLYRRGVCTRQPPGPSPQHPGSSGQGTPHLPRLRQKVKRSPTPLFPRGAPRRASRSMFAKPPPDVCLSKTGHPCAAPATHPRMDEDPACPVARSIKCHAR